MPKSVWLVYNLMGDSAICNTEDGALKEAHAFDTFRQVYFPLVYKKYPCVVYKTTKKEAEQDLLALAKAREERSNYSYF